MANQVALRMLTRPGDDIIVSREAHAVWHEAGGSAANAGVQLTEIGARGAFSEEEFHRGHPKPRRSGRFAPRRRAWHRVARGAMRQVGIFAAAGIFALDNNMTRLVEDHANARLIAERLARSRRILIDLATVQTNILVFQLSADAPAAATLVAQARERGVLINAFGPRTVRAVTHLDVSREQCARAADVLLDLPEAPRV